MSSISRCDPAQIFQSDLLPKEKILWAGQPAVSLSSSRDLYLIPLGLFFVVILWFWILGPAGVFSGSPQHVPFGVCIFVSIALYHLFGLFIIKPWKRRNTYYAVTNQRILVRSLVPRHLTQTLFIEDLPSLSKSMNSDGTGSIGFGNTNPFAARYSYMPMNLFVSGGLEIPAALYDINDVNRVYDLINQARKQK